MEQNRRSNLWSNWFAPRQKQTDLNIVGWENLTDGLLVAQSFDRAKACGASRREIAEDHADGG